MTKDEKNQMIDERLKQYEQKIFFHEMNRTALLAVGDQDGLNDTDKRIEALQKAYKAVEGMKEA